MVCVQVKGKRVSQAFNSATKFTKACAILSENSIPEACQAGLISMLGYDVVWPSMNSDDAVLVKRN